MGELVKALGQLAANPSGLLVLGGLALLLLGVWGRIEGRISLDYPSRIASGIIGVILTASGVLLQINTSPSGKVFSRDDEQTLQAAYSNAQSGNFKEAIKVANRIPQASLLFPRAQQKVQQWSILLQAKQESADHAVLQRAFDASSSGDFRQAVKLAKTISTSTSVYAIAQLKVVEWTESIATQSRALSHASFSKAYTLADQGKFGEAIKILEQFIKTSDSPADRKRASQKISEWKLAIRSSQKASDVAILQASYQFAEKGDFQSAISKAETISHNSEIAGTVARKISQWRESMRIRQNSAPH